MVIKCQKGIKYCPKNNYAHWLSSCKAVNISSRDAAVVANDFSILFRNALTPDLEKDLANDRNAWHVIVTR